TTHVAVAMTIDPQKKVPVSSDAVSRNRSFQVPLTAGPALPLNVLSGSSGRNVPAKGALPDSIAAAAPSSRVVRLEAGEHAVPKLSALPPRLMIRLTAVLSGAISEMTRSESNVCVA